MQDFINKYGEEINGVLSGFDRLVFRGTLRRLNYGYWDGELQSVVALGMEQYLGLHRCLIPMTSLPRNAVQCQRLAG
jgi:hypothetical protein